MKPDARRVYVFIALGLLFALFVGYGVWRVSTPDTVASHSTSESVTQVGETESQSKHTSQTTTTSSHPHSKHSSKSHKDSSSRKRAAALKNDPFLAPNAFTGSASNTGPTLVYRPENLSSQSRATAQQNANGTYATGYPQEPSNSASGTAAPTPSTQATAQQPTSQASAPSNAQPSLTETVRPKRGDSDSSQSTTAQPVESSPSGEATPDKINGTEAPATDAAPTFGGSGDTVDAPQPSSEPTYADASKEPIAVDIEDTNMTEAVDASDPTG